MSKFSSAFVASSALSLAVLASLGIAAVSRGSAASYAAAQLAPTKRAATIAPVLFPSPNEAAVVDAANAFLATLTEKQRTVAQIELTHPLAAKWSNFPSAVVQRNGVFFRDMTTAQSAAALKIARLALSEEGYKRFEGVRAADDQYAKIDKGPGGGPGGPGGRGPGGGRGRGGFGGGPGGQDNGGGPPDNGGFGGRPGGFGGRPGGFGGRPGGFGGRPGGFGGGGPGGMTNLFGKGNYMIAFLGKPSKTSPWLLQIGGHHLAFNLLYKGATGAATPYFVGAQPNVWKDAEGKTHAPLAAMRDAMYALVHSLTPEQSAKARLAGSFNDVLVGPGRDGQFPDEREGVSAAELSSESIKYLKAAIGAWTGDSVQDAAYRKRYFAELDKTKVSYSGSPALKGLGDYVRIDGPHVWIEFVCQGDDHYHTIWRDRETDYGAEFAD